MVEVLLKRLASAPRIPMVGVVASGEPIELFPQLEAVEVPPAMVRSGETFALRVKGESMREEGILPGDLLIVHKQPKARHGQVVVAVVNNEATVKTLYRNDQRLE